MIDVHAHVRVDEREYARLLGYPPERALEGEVRRLAEGAMRWYRRRGTPRVTTCSTAGGLVAGITAGGEVDARVDELWRGGRVDEAYFLDRLAAAVVEALGARMDGVARSPGTTGIPMEEQWSLMRELAPLEPGIELLESGALRPKHSLLALFVPGERGVPCHRCDLPRCAFRRAA